MLFEPCQPPSLSKMQQSSDLVTARTLPFLPFLFGHTTTPRLSQDSLPLGGSPLNSYDDNGPHNLHPDSHYSRPCKLQAQRCVISAYTVCAYIMIFDRFSSRNLVIQLQDVINILICTDVSSCPGSSTVLSAR